MIVVQNQLYSFHYSQVPGFERIYELARQHSYAPVEVDQRHFENLPPEHRLVARRQTLDSLPNEAAILQQEYELAQSKGIRSHNRLLWHCIGAQQANRWSKGFVIPDTWLDAVVAKLRHD